MYPYTCKPLPYSPEALEPFITAQTMKFHYGKHYQAYVENFNRVLANQVELKKQSLSVVLSNAHQLDANIRQSIINFAGGVYNHELFWEILGVDRDQQPTGNLAQAIVRDFGSFDEFQKQLSVCALGWFGSGWGWLCVDQNKKLIIIGTGNQDCPLSINLYPLMNIDIWEHAYYLQYQNRRAEFIAACWHIFNWRAIENRYKAHLSAQ